ncbi:hypothetical protein GCM10027578_27400 [Spirosoma luteolum]
MLTACTDHRLGELTPQRLRLKRTVSTLPGFPGTTVFNYDSQGRESSFTYEGYEGRFTYDSQNRVRDYNYIKSDAPNASDLYYFTYLGADTVRMYHYVALLYQGNYSPQIRLRDYQYQLNSAKQPVSVYDAAPGAGPVYHSGVFTYSGGNLTRRVDVSFARAPLNSNDYQFDDKINPYYDLIGPGITEQRRYSLNNIIRSTYTPDVRFPTANQTTEVASYEYNAQGYPTSVTYPSGKVTFEYERY